MFFLHLPFQCFMQFALPFVTIADIAGQVFFQVAQCPQVRLAAPQFLIVLDCFQAFMALRPEQSDAAGKVRLG
jgi:hypothetical protein